MRTTWSSNTVALGNRWRVAVALALAAVLGLAAGCTDDEPDAPGGKGKAAGNGVAITGPAPDAKDVPTSTEITYDAGKATDAKVELKSADGAAVKGAPSPDGKSWVPAEQLDYGSKYTVTVTATRDGKTGATTASFTTMARPGKQVRVSTFLGDDVVVGVGMPLMVTFGREIPADMRDDVQRRIFLSVTPPQEGAWSWASGTEIHYRPKVFWKAGTKFQFRAATGGLPMGGGWFGRSDLTIRASVGPAVVMTVDNASKRMRVTRDGKLLRTIPVSLGKKSTPSSYGVLLVMEKYRKTVFDTYAELGRERGYRTDIEYAQRITYGGEFIHSAPWSVRQQGRTNVSHGCVNMSESHAKWLFGITRVGDPVTVKGTERKIRLGNGWTDWNVPWEEFVKGSAIPYTPPSEPAEEPSEPAEEPTPDPTG